MKKDVTQQHYGLSGGVEHPLSAKWREELRTWPHEIPLAAEYPKSRYPGSTIEFADPGDLARVAMRGILTALDYPSRGTIKSCENNLADFIHRLREIYPTL